MKRFVFVLTLIGMLGAYAQAVAGELPAMTVWKSPWCGCCGSWVKHMKTAGFNVKVVEVEDLAAVKSEAAIPERLQSCHTARVGGFVIEGHVPAEDVKRLLAERPKALGLVVPGMPAGSPGMETGEHDPYDVLLLNPNGETEVFKAYR